MVHRLPRASRRCRGSGPRRGRGSAARADLRRPERALRQLHDLWRLRRVTSCEVFAAPAAEVRKRFPLLSRVLALELPPLGSPHLARCDRSRRFCPAFSAPSSSAGSDVGKRALRAPAVTKGRSFLIFLCPPCRTPAVPQTSAKPSSTSSRSAATGGRAPRSSPQNDPTLLFTNAGMVQFKDVFTGREKRDYTRATTSQKCVRAGGKHNDLDNVGLHRAPPHLLRDARQLLLRRLLQGGRDRVRLGVRDAGRSASTSRAARGHRLQRRRRAAPGTTRRASCGRSRACRNDRIFRLGYKDNFWAMGDTGPCGPCSEIHFYQGDDSPCVDEQRAASCQGVALRLRPLAGDLEPRLHAVRAQGDGRAADAAAASRPSTPARASSAWRGRCRASARTTTPICSAAHRDGRAAVAARSTARPTSATTRRCA